VGKVIIYVEDYGDGRWDYTNSSFELLAVVYDDTLKNLLEAKLLERGYYIKAMPDGETDEG
jgi:hypothetical protein